VIAVDKVVQNVTDTASSWFNAMPAFVRALVIVIGSFVAAVVYIARSVKKIEQGNVAMRLRWGKIILRYDKSLSEVERDEQKKADKEFLDKGQCAVYGRPRYFLSGWRWGIPEAHKWNIVDTRDRPIVLREQNVISKTKKFDGCKFVNPLVNIEVFDPYLFAYKSTNPTALIEATADTALSTILDEYTPQNVSANMQVISEKFMEATILTLGTIGVRTTSLQLGSKLIMTEGWSAQAIASLKRADIESVLEQFSDTDELDSSLTE
jgi:hypothetical protein